MYVQERFISFQALMIFHKAKLEFPGFYLRSVDKRSQHLIPLACETRPHSAKESSARSPPDVKFSARAVCPSSLLAPAAAASETGPAAAKGRRTTTTGFRHFRTTLFIWSTTPFLIPAAVHCTYLGFYLDNHVSMESGDLLGHLGLF